MKIEVDGEDIKDGGSGSGSGVGRGQIVRKNRVKAIEGERERDLCKKKYVSGVWQMVVVVAMVLESQRL